MDAESASPSEMPISMAESLGSVPGVAFQCFSVYVPNKDKNDKEIGTQRRWVLELIRLLSDINRGATAIPVEGGG